MAKSNFQVLIAPPKGDKVTRRNMTTHLALLATAGYIAAADLGTAIENYGGKDGVTRKTEEMIKTNFLDIPEGATVKADSASWTKRAITIRNTLSPWLKPEADDSRPLVGAAKARLAEVLDAMVLTCQLREAIPASAREKKNGEDSDTAFDLDEI